MVLENKISVFNIKRFAVHDGPGIRTTVFIKDCNLHCPWCQNPEGISYVKNLLYQKNKCIQCHKCISVCTENVIKANAEKYIWIDRNNCTLCGDCVDVCPTGALEFDSNEWKISDLIKELLKDKVFFEESKGGITISGGEPLLSYEIILELANELKKNAVHLAVETSLMVCENKLQEVVDVFDLFIVDIKLLHKTDALKIVGLNLDLYKKNLEFLFASDAELVCRFPLIPDYTTSETNLYATNSLINSLNKKYKRNVRVEPINFNPLIKSKYLQIGKPLPVLKNWNKFTQTEMQYFYTKLNHER